MTTPPWIVFVRGLAGVLAGLGVVVMILSFVFGVCLLALAGGIWLATVVANVERLLGLLVEQTYHGPPPPSRLIMDGPAFGREWHVGQQILRATFVRVENGAVVLQRQDGRLVQCNPATLSIADRQHVNELTAAQA